MSKLSPGIGLRGVRGLRGTVGILDVCDGADHIVRCDGAFDPGGEVLDLGERLELQGRVGELGGGGEGDVELDGL